MLQPKLFNRKLAEIQGKSQSGLSIESAAGAVGLDQEEINSSDTRYGNVDATILSQFMSTADKQALDYQNSVAKQEIDLVNKKEVDDAVKQLDDTDKTIKELESNKDNYDTITNPLEVSSIGPKSTLGSQKIKPEVQQQIDALKSQKAELATQFEGHPELENITQKIATLENKYRNYKGAQTDTDFTSNPFMWAQEGVQNTTANIVNAFTNPEKSMTPKEKIEYNKLISQRDTFYKPIAAKKAQERENEAINLGAALYEANTSGGRTVGDRIRLFTAKRKAELSKQELDAYINGEGGSDAFFRKLGMYTASSQGGGAEDAVQNISDYVFKNELQEKSDKVGYDNLSKEEKDLLYTYASTDEDKSFLADKQKWSYGLVDQTMHSMGFVRDIVLADALSGGLLTAVLPEGSAALGAGRIALEAGARARRGGMLQIGGARVAANVVATGAKAARFGASTLLQNHMNPEYLNNEMMKGSYVERDEDGNVKNILVKDGYYNYMKDVYKDTAIAYDTEAKQLEQKENKTAEDQERLNYLQVKLGITNDVGEHSLAEELETFKPLSGASAELAAFGKMGSERIAEIYTEKLLRGLGKQVVKLPGVGKYATKLETKLNDVNSAFKNTKVGRLYNSLSANTRRVLNDGNGNPIVNSLPTEVIEEYVTAGLNSVQDRDLKELHDMFDVQANVDIAAQTFLMTSMFGLSGNVQTNSKLMLNKLANKRISEAEARVKSMDKTSPEYADKVAELEELKKNPYVGSSAVKLIAGTDDASFQGTRNYIDTRNQVRNSIKELKAANQDSDVNRIVDLMSTSGFSSSEIKTKIAALKAEGKDKEAKSLESTMFQTLVFDAFKGGVQDELQTALGKMQKNTKLSEDTRLAANKAEQNLDALSKVYERYKDKPNIGAITNFAYEKLVLRQGADEVSTEQANISEQVNDEIKAYTQATGNYPPAGTSLSNMFTATFEDATQQARYDKFLDGLLNYNNTIIDTYIGLENSKNTLNQQLSNSMMAFNEAVTPSQATLNRETFLTDLQKLYEAVDSGEHTIAEATFNYNNDLQQTPELIDALFEQMKSRVGNIKDGKISNDTFEKLKTKFKNQIEDRKKLENLKALLQEQANVNALRTEEEQANEIIIAPTVTIIDTEAEDDFKDALVIDLGNTANLFEDDNLGDPSNDVADSEFDLQIGNTYSPEQIKAITAFVKKTVENIETKLDRRPSFREFMSQTYKYAEDKNQVKKIFNASIEGWKANGYEADNYQEVYNDLFNPFQEDVTAYLEAVTNMFETEVPAQEVTTYDELDTKTEEIEEQVARVEQVTVAYDEENVPIVRTIVDDISSQRTLNIEPKLGFSAIVYDEVIENGVLIRKSRGSVLNISPDSLIDFRDLLNPDTYKTGDKLNIEVADESLWSGITVSNGRDANDDVQTTSFAAWVSEREKIDSNFRSSQEFRNKMPIFYSSDAGKRLAYVQDTDWYNPFNVGNPFGESKDPNNATQAWLDHIQEGKNNTQELRNNIARGLKQVTINKPEDGKFYKIPEEEPLITVNESNPQSVIAVQRGTDLNTSFANQFSEGVLLNTNFKGERGFDSKTNSHTWMINRIGFTTNDKGEVVPSYRAYPVLRLVTNDQIETVKWALAAHLTLKGWTQELSGVNAKYAMTIDQAKKLQRDINTNMSFNIENPKEIINFMKVYFQTKVDSDILGPYRNALFNTTETHALILQHTSLKALDNKNIKSIVHINNGVVTPLNQRYEEYLKNNLRTNIKSFDVGTNAKPVYATVIQPIINVSYTEVSETISPRQEAANVIIEQLQEEAKVNAPFDLSKHTEFLNSIGVDIDSFEQSDAMIDNTDKLSNIFKLPGNLNILQEKAIRQFIVHSIGEKASFDYKSLSNPAKIKAETLSELKLLINPVVKQIENLIAEVNGQDNSTGKYDVLLDAYNSTLKNIKVVQSNFSSIYEKGWKDVQKQTSLVLNEDENIDESEDDVNLSIKDYNKDSIEESGKSKASYRLRRFLHKIPTYNVDGTIAKTYLGLPQYMSFNDVYNELSKVLAMGSDVVSDYKLIIKKLEQSPSPFIKDVLRKLETADEQIKNEFVYNFVRHSLTSKFAMFDMGKSGTSLKVYDTNSNEASRVIRGIWLNNNKASELFTLNGKLNADVAQDLITEYESWDKDYTKVPQQELRNWLDKIGYTFTDGAWQQIYTSGVWNAQKQNNFNALYTQDKGGLFVPLVKYLRGAITNPSEFDFDNKKNIFSNLTGVTNALSLVEAQYNANLIALSFRDSGKNISTQVPTKFVTDMIQKLKRSLNEQGNTYIDDLQAISFSSESTTLELLKNNSEFARLMEISHLSLTAVKQRGDNPSKAGITDLGDIDYDLAVLTGFQDRKGVQFGTDNKINGIPVRMAHMLFPTMSDKTTGLFMRTSVFDFLKDSNLLFETAEDGKVTGLDDSVKDLLFTQLVMPELKRIINFHQKVKATNIKNYDNGAMLFHFIPALNTLTDESGVRLIEKLATIENYTIEDIVAQYGKAMKDTIERVIKKEVAFKMQQWNGYSRTDRNGNAILDANGNTTSTMFDNDYFTEVGKSPSKDYEIGVYDFVMNSLLFNAEVFKIFAGDIANYSQDKVFKEKGAKKLPYQIEEPSTYLSINKEIGVNLGKRLALLIAPGNKVANSYNEKYNQIFLEDAVDISENASYLVKNFYGQNIDEEIAKYRSLEDAINIAEQSKTDSNPEKINKIKDQMLDMRRDWAKRFPDLDAYFDIESTDAQEYSTWAEHLSLMERMGRITDSERNNIYNKLLSFQDLTKEELNLVLQPIKPVHTGSYINQDFDVNQMVYIKSSSFPLIPQLTAGTKLDELRVAMETLEVISGRYTRASFQTANKVGATKKTVNPFDYNSILAGVREYDENDVNSTVRVLDRNNFRIQQDVPFKSDKKKTDTVSMGTQFFKLLFGDGMYNIEDFNLNGRTVTGKKLYEHYNYHFSEIVNNKKQELFMDLGLDSNGQVLNQVQFIKSLQNLLITEATSRGYSLKSLAGLKIEQLQAKAGYYYEFKTPLWLSSDSNRYESLLNAIITNRLMKHKMPGNGFIAGSESGFRYTEDLNSVDKSRIIYLDSWNGRELQGAHTTDTEGNVSFNSAQVFVPAKFKNSKNELIDLFEGFNNKTKEGKYVYRRDNGTLGLKEGSIDKELMNLFTFRTPTSSHVSGSSVEIAGILPPESGDLMIVPKNFTKQKGLDYDIDKESAYALNHYVDDNGAIRVLDGNAVTDMLQKYQNAIDKINKESNAIESKTQALTILKEMSNSSRFPLSEEDLLEFTNPEISVQDIATRAMWKLKTKLSENEFIRTHLVVFNNPNPVVQNKINKVLSIDFAKEQAAAIEKLEAEGEKNKIIAQYIKQGLSPLEADKKYQTEAMDYTMLTYSYQKNKMSLGSIGKIAIGVYANYTTFNGLLQQTEEQVFMRNKEGDPTIIKIGKYESNGILGAERTLDGERTTAEVFAEKENTATDNEKEQVLGRVGVNESTINVDAHMTLRGFDKDENGNSISYMLLSQPLVKELNKRRKDSKGILGEYIDDNSLIKSMIESLSNNTITYIQSGEGMDLEYYFTNKSDMSQVIIDGGMLSGNNMLDGITYNGENLDVQREAFMTYIELEKEAKAVSSIQKTINVNTLGKSMIESQLKYEGLKVLAENKKVSGVHNLLGNFLTKKPEDVNNGYWIGDYYVVPTTPQGQIVINGLHLGNTLYKDFFPYQDKAILDVVNEILSAKGKDSVSDATMIDNFETIVEGIRKYINSRQGNNIFNVSPKAKRFDLFKDTEDNTSLSTYMLTILKGDTTGYKKGLKFLKNNSLIKSFTYDTGIGNNEVSTIKYNNAATDNLDEEDLYNAIPELVLANLPLPERNGQPYSTMQLAEDLVAYSFLEGGVQEATQFIKYVPVEFLESIGQMENDVFVPANRKLQGFNSKKNSGINIFAIALGMKENETSTFTKQYFQHNPSDAARVSFKDTRGQSSFKYVNTIGKSPSFVSMKNKAKDEMNKFTLYQNMGNGNYQEIDTLGNFGISEYEYKNDAVASLMTNKVNVTPVASVQETELADPSITTALNIDNNTSIKAILGQISSMNFAPEYAHLSTAAEWLAPLAKNKGVFSFDNTIRGAGLAMRESLDIRLNPSMTIQESDEKTALIFLHEFIHTVSTNELLQYFNNDGLTLKEGLTVPSYVSNLLTVFNEFRRLHSSEINLLVNKMNGKTDASLSNEFSDREKNVIYAGTNIFEFVTVAMTSPMFQEEMNKVSYKKSGLSLIEKLKDALMRLFKHIYPNIAENSVAEASILASLDFVQEEASKRRSIEQEDLLPADIMYELEREDAERLQYGGLTEPDIVNDVELSDPDSQNITGETIDLMIDNLENLPNFEPC